MHTFGNHGTTLPFFNFFLWLSHRILNISKANILFQTNIRIIISNPDFFSFSGVMCISSHCYVLNEKAVYKHDRCLFVLYCILLLTEINPCLYATVVQQCKDQDFTTCVHDGPGKHHCEGCMGGWTLTNGICKSKSFIKRIRELEVNTYILFTSQK